MNTAKPMVNNGTWNKIYLNDAKLHKCPIYGKKKIEIKHKYAFLNSLEKSSCNLLILYAHVKYIYTLSTFVDRSLSFPSQQYNQTIQNVRVTYFIVLIVIFTIIRNATSWILKTLFTHNFYTVVTNIVWRKVSELKL